jgi:predicted permease
MRIPPQGALREGSRTVAAGGSRLRSAIVTGQLAFCVLFLVMAGMFVGGLRSASAVDVGFTDPQHVLLVDTDLRAARVNDTTGVIALGQILDRIAALPGVKVASAASMVPLGFGGRRIVPLSVPGYAPALNEDMTAERAHVGPGYAAAMNIRIVAGRDIGKEDRADSRPVALVNEAFVRRFMQGAEPIGRTLDIGRGPATIVGVLHDGKYNRLDEGAHPMVYVPLAQWFLPSVTLHVRTSGDPIATAELVRRSLIAVNVDLPALQMRTLAEHIAAATFTQRTGATVLGAFAALALLLSAVGLYGALAFGVALRSRELAIRMALGAARRGVVWIVARHALVIAAAGLVIGIALSVPGGRLLRSQISSVGAGDPMAFLVAALVLLVAAALAAWIPASRAARVDPAAALRGE